MTEPVSIDDARRRHDGQSAARVPPHDLQAEESLLGAMLLDRRAIESSVGVVTAADFYSPANGHVFRAIAALHARGEPSDQVTVADEMRRAGAFEHIPQGPSILITLQANTPAPWNADRYAEIVRRDSLDRALGRAAGEVQEAVFSRADPGPALDQLAGARDARSAAASNHDDLFRVWPARELIEADRSFRWLMRGLLVHPTYGMLAGERKTLKSYLATFINISVSAGVPLFGHFEVDQGQPVVSYVGEGGRIPYTRRLERVARAMGVDLRHLPLYSSFDVAPVQSQIFADTLARDLKKVTPGLVTLDPLYAFHGSQTNASNLFEEGSLLSSMSAPCVDAGASLLTLSHFNKTGGGRGLSRITQAGAQEWADTWVLLSHREAPNVAEGQFKLLLEIGSRQWGGSEWDLDLNVGRFDVELGEFDGDISWDLRRHRDPIGDSLEAKVLRLVSDHPYQLTKEDLAKGVGGNLQAARAFIDDLETKGAIGVQRVTRERSDGRKYQVWAFHLNHVSSEPGRCETTDDDECA